MIRALVLDTSTERGIIALVEHSKVMFHTELPFGLQNSQFLLPEIARGLQVTGFSLSDFSFIGVGIGPGSYTGIRVGATVAKTLGFAADLPLVGVSTLQTFLPDCDTSFSVVIDAKIGGAYMQQGECIKGRGVFQGSPEVYSLVHLLPLLKTQGVLVTPHMSQLKSKLAALAPDGVWQWQEKYPSPLQLVQVAEAKFLRGEYSVNGELELLYLRKTQAEIEREALKKNRGAQSS